MKQSIRHQKIVDLVTQKGYVSTEDLVALLGVSSPTIRRDLNNLAEKNIIRRHHGGATLLSSSENSDYAERKHFFLKEKNCIAQKVASLIPNGASLFIDIGTTPEAVAEALLNHQNLRIVTNNINAAYILMKNETFDIVLAGGFLRQDGGIIGEVTIALITQFRLDFGILGISGIDSDGSLLDYDYHEVQVKRAIIKSSRETFLVTDHSKFIRRAMVRLGAISDVHNVVTDALPPKPILDILREKHVKLHVCE